MEIGTLFFHTPKPLKLRFSLFFPSLSKWLSFTNNGGLNVLLKDNKKHKIIFQSG